MSSTTIETVESVAQPIALPGYRRTRLWQALLPYLLILPTFLLIFVFTLWPTVSAMIQSTIKPGVTVQLPAKFVGLDNYRDLFDPTTDIGQTFPHVLLQHALSM